MVIKFTISCKDFRDYTLSPCEIDDESSVAKGWVTLTLPEQVTPKVNKWYLNIAELKRVMKAL